MNTTRKKAANSIVGKLTAGILATGAVFLAPPAAAQTGGEAVLVVGDSLAVGSGPYVRQALGGLSVEVDAKRSRTSSEGLRVLGAKLRAEHDVVVFDLGTNDTSASAFGSNLVAARELAGGRCMVVATISRPPLRGSAAGPLNRVIEQFAAQGNVQVADWRSATATTPGVLGRDRTHATGQGYALRGSLLAEAVQGCLLGGDFGGIPAPEDPNARPPEARRRGRPRRRRPPPARPAKLPAPAVIDAFGTMAGRVVSLVAAAGRGAQTAAAGPAPEPVLGAP
jgi:lysophospholipase L1-like esterase